jgi:hypothetical protein
MDRYVNPQNYRNIQNKAFYHQRTAWLGLICCDDHRHGVSFSLFAVVRDKSRHLRMDRYINPHKTANIQNKVF